ncbi:MAG: transporter substrate-binding domain-containing protein [Gammaproteobacteria bacterium]|nr:transporter substrate-binding domain-containing protein [Gammaproteobacteria bacterium]
MKRFLLAILLAFTICAANAAPMYRIGVFQSQPYSSYKDKQFNGLSVAIWKAIAQDANIKYKFVPLPGSTDAALKVLNEGKVDAVVGPISVTRDRINKFGFSRPYLLGRLGLITTEDHQSTWGIARHVFKELLSTVFVIYVICLLIYTTLFWLAELRHKNRIFTRHTKLGAWWLALHYTTLFFLSQNPDDIAKSDYGRILNQFLIIASVVFSSIIVGTISAAITISHSELAFSGGPNTQNASSFYGYKFAAIAGSHAASVTDNLGGTVIAVPSYPEGIDLLKQKKVTAVVGDFLALRYFKKQTPNDNYFLEQFNVGMNELAFAFKPKSPLIKKIDKALVSLQGENQAYGICQRFVGPTNALLCII